MLIPDFKMVRFGFNTILIQSGLIRQRILLCAGFFILALVYVYFIRYNGLYGQDAYSYLRFSKELKQLYTVHTPVSEFYWPALYPLSGMLISCLFSPVFSLQLISVLSMTLTFFFLSKIIALLYGRSFILHFSIAVAWLSSPYLFRLGISCMSDMQSIFFAVMCFYFLILFEKKHKQYPVLLAAVSATLSVFTHFESVVLILPMVVIFLFRNFNRIRIRLYLFSAFFSLIVAGIAMYFNYEALTHITHDQISGNWSIINYLSRSHQAEVEGLHHFTLPNLAFVFSLFFNPGFGMAGLLVIIIAIYMKIKIRVELYSATCVLTGVLFFSGLPEQNTRHISILYPFILIMFMPVLVELLPVVRQKIIPFFLLTMLLLNILIIPRAVNPFRKYNAIEQQIARYAKQFGNRKLIYCMGLTDILKAYEAESQVFDLYNEKIISIDSNALAIIDEQALQLQWKNKLPNQNYKILKNYLGLKKPELVLANYSIYKLN